MNLILPENEQLPTDKTFISYFFNYDNYIYTVKPEKIDELKLKFKFPISK
jgi:hypothetical protein